MADNYDTSVPCGVCGAKVNEPCVRYTNEFDEPGSQMGDPTPWPHHFGGRS